MVYLPTLLKKIPYKNISIIKQNDLVRALSLNQYLIGNIDKAIKFSITAIKYFNNKANKLNINVIIDIFKSNNENDRRNLMTMVFMMIVSSNYSLHAYAINISKKFYSIISEDRKSYENPKIIIQLELILNTNELSTKYYRDRGKYKSFIKDYEEIFLDILIYSEVGFYNIELVIRTVKANNKFSKSSSLVDFIMILFKLKNIPDHVRKFLTPYFINKIEKTFSEKKYNLNNDYFNNFKKIIYDHEFEFDKSWVSRNIEDIEL